MRNAHDFRCRRHLKSSWGSCRSSGREDWFIQLLQCPPPPPKKKSIDSGILPLKQPGTHLLLPTSSYLSFSMTHGLQILPPVRGWLSWKTLSKATCLAYIYIYMTPTSCDHQETLLLLDKRSLDRLEVPGLEVPTTPQLGSYKRKPGKFMTFRCIWCIQIS